MSVDEYHVVCLMGSEPGSGVSIYILLGGPSAPDPDFGAPIMRSPPPPIFIPLGRRPHAESFVLLLRPD